MTCGKRVFRQEREELGSIWAWQQKEEPKDTALRCRAPTLQVNSTHFAHVLSELHVLSPLS